MPPGGPPLVVDHANVKAAEQGRGLVHHAGRLAVDGQIAGHRHRTGQRGRDLGGQLGPAP